MKLKGAILATTAILLVGLTSQAQAADRISVYEANSFVAELTNAVNNPNPGVLRSFLMKNVSVDAMFDETLNQAWAVNGFHPYHLTTWNGYYGSPYYRYPYAYNAYYEPVSQHSSGKMELISQLEHKKNMIPRYHQTINVLGATIPSDASSVVLDIRLKEFGLSYGMAPYGVQYGQQIEHTDSRCALHLKKQNGDILLTKLNCNKVLRAPI